MHKWAGIIGLLMLLAFAGIQAQAQTAKGVAMKDLPPAVQTAIKAETQAAEIKRISKEVENGKTQYEVETTRNGKSRDINFDASGKVLVIEEATDLESIPPAARAAIERRAGNGRITSVETITRNGVADYEAAFTTKAGKKMEVVVKANGTPTR